MKFHVSPDGLFLDLWAVNECGEKVYPHLKRKRNSAARGFDVTLNGRKEDYHLVSLEQLITHIANGDFDAVGRVRMKPRSGGQSNGFAIRTATISENLANEVERRRD